MTSSIDKSTSFAIASRAESLLTAYPTLRQAAKFSELVAIEVARYAVGEQAERETLENCFAILYSAAEQGHNAMMLEMIRRGNYTPVTTTTDANIKYTITVS